MDGEPLARWGAIARSLHGRKDIMFGPVITTAEMTAMVEALSFLRPRGLVARDTNSCIYCDSKHAARVCLGTTQARTHVQLAGYYLPCNDRTATPGIWVMNMLIMLPHLGHSATRWVRHNFDISSCFDACNNIGEVLENCVAFELKHHRYSRTRFSAVSLIGLSMTVTHAMHQMLCALSPFTLRSFLLYFVVP